MQLLHSAIFLAMIAAVDNGSRPSSGDKEHYRAAALRAGRDAEQHAQLALWCYAHHLKTEHDAELVEALRLSPNNTLARALRGEIRQQDRWLTADQVVTSQNQPHRQFLLKEYRARRDAAGDSVKGNLEMARWCASQGLRGEELAHLTAVIRRDPTHAEAWRALGYHSREGIWTNAAHELKERRLHAEAKEAHRHWTNRLKDLMRERSKPENRPTADAELDKIRDPEAVSAIARVLGNGSIEHRQLAAHLLGQIDGPESTSRLTWLALLDREGPVRGDAIAELARRDPREFIGPVIEYVRKPPTIAIKSIGGPGEPGKIEVEGMQPRIYAIPTMEEFQAGTGNAPAPIDSTWLSGMASRSSSRYVGGYSYSVTYYPSDPVVMQAFAQLAANPGEASPILRGLSGLAAGNHSNPPPVTYHVVIPSRLVFDRTNSRGAVRQMINNIRNYKTEVRNRYNAYRTEVRNQFNADSKIIHDHVNTIEETTRNALGVLQQASGLDLGIDRAPWAAWWARWNRSEPGIGNPVPTTPADVAADVPAQARNQLHRPRFATGTRIWTARGQKPVESLKVGDMVLSQEPLRGALGYQGVVALTAPEPDTVLRLRLDQGSPIVLSVLESVWKAGVGWVHAQEIKPGDEVRVIGGQATVVSSDPDPATFTVNIVLADEGTLFAGERGMLAHDNSIVHPPARPFDAIPELAPSKPAP